MVTEKEMPPAEHSQSVAERANETLKKYLLHYTSLNSPGYATLVTGDWGAGKSYQIKKIIPEETRIYISLFGLTNTQEIYASVFAATYPTKAKIKAATNSLEGAGFSTPLGGIELGGLVSSLAGALIKNKVDNNKTIIFDDLERCNIDINDLLGVVNKYIEHNNCKVIVVAHDEKLKNEFLSSKEKIFGKTIRVEADFESAYDHFTQDHIKTPSLKNTFTEHKDSILETARQSKSQSLRILKHVLDDLALVYSSLTDEQLKNTIAIRDLSKLFTAYAIPIRLGELTPADIRSREDIRTSYYLRTRLQSQDTKIKPALISLAERHTNLDLSNTILSENLLEEMLFNGTFNPLEIKKCISQSRYYSAPEKMPSWRAFMEIDSVEHEISEMIVEKVNTDFNEIAIKNRPEILHLFAIQLLLSDRKINNLTLEETVDKCKNYIDKLLISKEIEPAPKHKYRYERSHRSYGGFGYWIHENYEKHFSELETYITNCQDKALRDNHPLIIESILNSDGNYLTKLLSDEGINGTSYTSTPILNDLAPKKFVDYFFNLPTSQWSLVSSALKSRYSAGLLTRELKDELPWLEGLVIEFEKLRDSSPPLLRFRLDRNIPWVLKDFIRSARS